ncbi:hypothetical protein [Streptomyces hiroshimensis]|nr:hypothetical protein [Streptomyces hiroshimensis]
MPPRPRLTGAQVTACVRVAAQSAPPGLMEKSSFVSTSCCHSAATPGGS